MLYTSKQIVAGLFTVENQDYGPWDFQPTDLAVTLCTYRTEQKQALSHKLNLKRCCQQPYVSLPSAATPTQKKTYQNDWKKKVVGLCVKHCEMFLFQICKWAVCGTKWEFVITYLRLFKEALDAALSHIGSAFSSSVWRTDPWTLRSSHWSSHGQDDEPNLSPNVQPLVCESSRVQNHSLLPISCIWCSELYSE